MIPRLEGELAEIREILMDGVQKLIDRGERLDELVRKTQSLQIMVNRVAIMKYQFNRLRCCINKTCNEGA